MEPVRIHQSAEVCNLFEEGSEMIRILIGMNIFMDLYGGILNEFSMPIGSYQDHRRQIHILKNGTNLISIFNIK